MATYKELINKGGTIYNTTTQQGYQNPEQLATDLGVQSPDINWGAITSESLKPEPAINLNKAPEDTTNYQGIINGGTSLMDLTKTQAPTEDWFSKFLSTDQAPASLSDEYSNLYGQSGLEAKQADVIAKQTAQKQAQNELNLINAQLQGLQTESQAIPIKLQQEATGRGITAGGLAPIQTAQLRDLALRALPLQAQAYVASAKATAAQGDTETAQQILNAAQGKFDQLFSIRSQDIENQYNYKKEQRDRVYDYLSAKEQQQIDAMNKRDDRVYQESRDNLSMAQEWTANAISSGNGNIASQISQLDVKSSTFQQDLGKLTAQLTPKPVYETIQDDTGAIYQVQKDPISGQIVGTPQKIFNAKPVVVSGGGGGTKISTTPSGQVDVSILSPEAQAVISGTLRLEDLTPTVKGKIAGELMAAGYSSQPKLSSAQQDDLATMDNVSSSLDKILAYNEDGKLEGIGSFGQGTLKGWAAQLGFGSEEGKTVRALLGNIKGTIAKLRGGTSFTTNEERLLDTYTPSINDNPSVAINKINLLKQFIADKKSLLYQFAQDRNLPQSNLEADALRSKYNY